MGHSVGEIAAMCVAGGMTLADGLTLIAARGRLMQALPAGGGMTSVMASEARVVDALAGAGDRVAIAAVNGPRHVVLSGERTAVDAVAAELAADGIKTRPLTVSHAFHSPLMLPMIADYEAVVRQIAFRTPVVPFVSCVDGQLSGPGVTTPEYWLRNVTDPVRFADGVAALRDQGVTACLEIGPQPVLLGMARECAGEQAEELLWLPSLRKDGDTGTTLGSLAKLYVRGAEIAWEMVNPGLRTSLPGYPFARKRFWISPVPQAAARQAAPAPPVRQPGHQLYALDWQPQPAQAAAPSVPASWVVFADDDGVGDELGRILQTRGDACTLVTKGSSLDPWTGRDRGAGSVRAELEQLFDRAGSAERPLKGAVFLWASAPDAAPHAGPESSPELLSLETTSVRIAAAHESLRRVVDLAQAASARTGARAVRVWLATRNAVDTGTASGRIALEAAPWWGFARTMALEAPDAWGGIVDLPSRREAGPDAQRLAAEISGTGDDDQVVYRDGNRLVPRLIEREKRAAAALRLDSAGAYIVTGGLGALGRQSARWLIARGARHIVLASRTGGANAGDAVRELEALGATVTVIAADVSKRTDVERLIATVQAGPAPLRGVIHAAGIDPVAPLASITAASLDQALDPKVDGGWWLHELTRQLPLDLFLTFSSVAGVLGSATRAHYAAANTFLDALAAERRREGLPALTVSWGPWKGGGMASAASLEQFERIGNYGLDPADALKGLDEAIADGAAADQRR